MLRRFHTKPLLFAGSSLELIPAELLAHFDVRAPVKRGDLPKLLDKSGKCHRIILADGIFGSEMSVTPQECRHILERGNVLIGCSSMGALRAADCRTVGMIGVGKVFLGYAAGYYRSDADVAVIYDRESRRELGISFVHIESILKKLKLNATIDGLQYRFACRAVRALPWEQRYLPSVLKVIQPTLDGNGFDQVKEQLLNPASNPKKLDCLYAAQTLLETLK